MESVQCLSPNQTLWQSALSEWQCSQARGVNSAGRAQIHGTRVDQH